MCNANHHPPECRCGWGGDGHTGGGHEPSQQHPATLPPLGFRHYDSYVVPNASCPVCRAKVFFYQSPDGGRVYFDELGPPWPKHPCTNNGSIPTRTQVVLARQLPEAPTWLAEGWAPLLYDYIGTIPPPRPYCSIRGTLGESEITLYVAARHLPAGGLYHVKKLGVGRYRLSVLYIPPKHTQPVTALYFAFQSPTAAAYLGRRTSAGQSTKRHKKKANPGTTSRTPPLPAKLKPPAKQSQPKPNVGKSKVTITRREKREITFGTGPGNKKQILVEVKKRRTLAVP